jgi:hypothetical protein
MMKLMTLFLKWFFKDPLPTEKDKIEWQTFGF